MIALDCDIVESEGKVSERYHLAMFGFDGRAAQLR